MRLVGNVARYVFPFAVLALLTWPASASAQDKKDDEALKALDKTSLGKLVEAAAKEGTPVAAEVRVKGTKTEVIVYVEIDGKTKEVSVDPKTGTAGKPTEPPAKDEKGDQYTKAKDISKQLDDNKLTLAKLIENAEEHSGGKAISIKPKHEGGRFDFTTHVKANGKWQYVVIDGKTGKAKGAADKGKQEQKPAQPTPSGKGGVQPPGKGAAPAGGKGGGRRPGQ